MLVQACMFFSFFFFHLCISRAREKCAPRLTRYRWKGEVLFFFDTDVMDDE